MSWKAKYITSMSLVTILMTVFVVVSIKHDYAQKDNILKEFEATHGEVIESGQAKYKLWQDNEGNKYTTFTVTIDSKEYELEVRE